jgi:DNA repair protein RadC
LVPNRRQKSENYMLYREQVLRPETSRGASGPGARPRPGPRERLLTRGVQALSTAELLSVCLRTGAPGVSALELAEALLLEFGGLGPLLELPPGRLLALTGLGPAKVAGLFAAMALAERRATDALAQTSPLTDVQSAAAFIGSVLSHRSRELFGCLMLDARHRALGFEVLFAGSLDRAAVSPREVLKSALTYNAASLIVGHNHPSGVCEPSVSDRRLTERLTGLLAEVDIRVLDHIIVAGKDYFSFAERGLMPGSARHPD